MKNTINVERAKKNMTQEQLAKKVHVTRQSIHAIEKNKSEPSLPLAMKIAKFFGVKIEDIFED